MPEEISHCQITLHFQPRSSNSSLARLSRLTFAFILSAQYSTLLFGSPERLHPWLCQKHPCTNKATLCLGKTRSGRPGRSARCRRKRSPFLCSAWRTFISGPVSLDLTLDMILLRVRLSTWSTNVHIPSRDKYRPELFPVRYLLCAILKNPQISPSKIFDTRTRHQVLKGMSSSVSSSIIALVMCICNGISCVTTETLVILTRKVAHLAASNTSNWTLCPSR